jgi:tRNA pseudouridine55 synthase
MARRAESPAETPQTKATVDGILNIDKPGGVTSYRIVALVKRLSNQRRVGHAGTLDPIATGVLPICLGQGTRIVEYLAESPKTYQAQIELGVATDTYDATGQITGEADPSGISREQVASALDAFRGVTEQTPPMYSAVKHRGQRLYHLARSGVWVTRRSRPVEIYELEIVNWQPPQVTVMVSCAKGTYIRSLAHDLGQSLGCGANLKGLVRSRYGPFDIKTAITVPRLEDAFRQGCWQRFLHPIDTVLQSWSAVVVNEATERAIGTGQPVSPAQLHPDAAGESRCRAYALDGRFLAVLSFDPERGQWRPDKVFSAGDQSTIES